MSQLLVKDKYIARIKSGSHALILPLGASAKLAFHYEGKTSSPIIIKVTDISGKSWAIGPIDQDLINNTKLRTTLLNAKVIIDVRTPKEYQKGYLSKAVNIPVEESEENI